MSRDKRSGRPSLADRLSRQYALTLVVLNIVVLLALCANNISYLYREALVDMAQRVVALFEDSLSNPEMKDAFHDSRAYVFRQQLADLNKYSRPENVQIYVVFPDGVTSYYNQDTGVVDFQLLPPEFFNVFQQAVLQKEMVSPSPLTNRLSLNRWIVAIPIRDSGGLSGGMVITSILLPDILRYLAPIFVVVGISFLISALLFLRVRRHLVGTLAVPLNQVTTALENWRVNNYKSPYPGITRSDEIGQLAKALSHMAAELEADRERREQDDESRYHFFSDVSHELKTPVASLRAQIELLSDGLATPEELPQYYENLQRETMHIQHLVEDLLLLSKLQAPHFTMEMEPCCLTDIIRDIFYTMEPLAGRSGVSLSFSEEVASAQAIVLGNYTRLRQMVLIFVENAVKYSGSGSKMVVTLAREGTQLLLTVQDNGRGIPADEADKVFQRQYRASNSGSREGSGLGLPIAQTIAKHLGATLSLSSQEHVGTTVSVSIPAIDPSQLVESSAASAAEAELASRS